MFASEIRTRDRPHSGDRRQETGDAVLWSAQRVWGCLTDWVMERVGRADGGIPTIRGHSKSFFGGRKIIFRKFEFWRIAVPAVSDNRASRLLEFRHGDEISGTRSGTLRARSGAGRASHAAIAASRLLEFRHGDETSGTERDAPGTVWSRMLQLRCDCGIPGCWLRDSATQMRPGSERGVGELGKTRRSRDWHGRRQPTGCGQNIGMAAHWLASLETRAPA